MELSIKEILQIEQEAIDEAKRRRLARSQELLKLKSLNNKKIIKCFPIPVQINSKVISLFSSEFGYRTYKTEYEDKDDDIFSLYYMGPMGTLRSDGDAFQSKIIWTFVLVFLVLGFMVYTWYSKARSEKYSEERLN